ncbi:Sex-determining fem-1 [Fusarium circinatum]|uniref:Sex-determining fem-1 n=1 Tax=Fusarium circinatum TaxID=48490 RepID=A0A8H5SVG3_FUSCI|nr:Sex-determining fem-1 [Fusarium circinatum]
MISDEYLVKDTSLRDLVILLKAQGLNITKGQLEYKLKSWNLSKNMDKETWQYIDRKIRKRKDEGKDSDVIHRGKILKKVKVKKETNRHRETNIFARFKTRCVMAEIPQADIAKSLMMSMLTSGEENRSVALLKLIAGANNAIPESYPGEHEEIAQNMLAGHWSESSSKCFELMVYMMSNSMLVQDNRHLWFIFNLMENEAMDTVTEFKKLRNEKPAIRAFLEKLFQLAMRVVTSVAIGSSIDYSKYLARIKWLLEVGIDPNCHCHVVFRRSPVLATPIQQAVDAGSLDLAHLLLRFQARADLPHGATNETAFVNLVLESRSSDAVRLRMLNLLFDHKFLSEDEMLRAAIELGDTRLVLDVLEHDPDVTSYKTAWLHPVCRRQQTNGQSYLANSSTLMMAVQAGGTMADYMLDHLLRRGQPTPTVLADAYIAAAYAGHYSIILRLDQLHVYKTICNREGITPLQAAVVGGDPRVCKHLLERYGGASTLLLLVAAELLKVDILQLLIDYGGDPNNPLYRDDFKLYRYLNMSFSGYELPSSILGILIHRNIRNISIEQSIRTLIQNGACLSRGDIAELSRRGFHGCLEVALAVGGNPNDEDESKCTALQYALDGSWSISNNGQASWGFRSAELLIETGAKLNGGEVVRAIDLQQKDLIMCLLRHGGTLTEVDGAGRGCLEAEIIAQNDPFQQEALEMQDFAIDAGPFCAAIHGQDWDLAGRLFERAHNPKGCHLLEGTAVGLAAQAGQLEILDKLLTRFTHPSVLCSAILPYRLRDGDIITLERDQQRLDYWRASKYEYVSKRIEASPLTLATLGNDTSGFRELLRRGCCMDRVAWSVVAESDRSSEYLRLLREFGCGLESPTKYDSELHTALCKTIKVGKDDLAKYLVEVGADVNRFDISTATHLSPLQCAIMEGNVNMTVYLLDNGANINAPPAYDKGATALQYAAICGYFGLAQHLIQLGARVNARGSSRFGRSALQGAAEHGRLDILALLVYHGAVTTGPGRQQLVTAVAYAQAGAHNTAAMWLKDNCGWDDTDQDALERIDVADETWMGCLMSFCCDEYHDNNAQCTYHYTQEQREEHIRHCLRCLRVRYRRDCEDGSDEDSISSSSDGDEDMETEDDETYPANDESGPNLAGAMATETRHRGVHDQVARLLPITLRFFAILALPIILNSMIALWLFLGLLALSTESVADGLCETSLGSSAVDTIHTSTTTRKGTITITDKIVIQTVPLNVTKSKPRLTRVPVTDKTASQRNGTVGNDTRPTDIRANPSTVGIIKTTTISAIFTKLATVTAKPEAKIATITVTKPSFVNHTGTMTKTETNRNTITTTTYFTTTIGRRPGFTAIRDNMERISSELQETTTTVGFAAELFSHTLLFICTDDMRVKTTITTTSLRAQTEGLPRSSTSTSIVTVWTAINETLYPSDLATTVTTTVNPIQTALINVTKSITVNETGNHTGKTNSPKDALPSLRSGQFKLPLLGAWEQSFR